MAAPVYLTKGELRDKLLLRLGFGGLGAGAGAFVPYADDLLEEAQETIFLLLPDDKRVREWPSNTGVNQRWYDIPATCDIDLITGIYIREDSTSSWKELGRGIDYTFDGHYDDTNNHPLLYDIRYNDATARTQIEMWPKPDSVVYEWKIEGKMDLDKFVADGDRASIDSRVILLYAIAYGKAHLNKSDKKEAMEAWVARKGLLKAHQHGTKRYIRQNPSKREIDVISKPKVTYTHSH